MRLAMSSVWRRLLWTRQFGSYLGEDTRTDAFETFVDVLRNRLSDEGEQSRLARPGRKWRARADPS